LNAALLAGASLATATALSVIAGLIWWLASTPDTLTATAERPRPFGGAAPVAAPGGSQGRQAAAGGGGGIASNRPGPPGNRPVGRPNAAPPPPAGAPPAAGVPPAAVPPAAVPPAAEGAAPPAEGVPPVAEQAPVGEAPPTRPPVITRMQSGHRLPQRALPPGQVPGAGEAPGDDQ